jgi:hypothetical protein
MGDSHTKVKVKDATPTSNQDGGVTSLLLTGPKLLRYS